MNGLRKNSNGCTRLQYFQASIAFDKDIETQECPNRIFFPVSCSSPFQNCNRAPTRRTFSPTARFFGHFSGSKKKEALMERSRSFDINSAATCISDPSNHMLVFCANIFEELSPFDSFGLFHFLTTSGDLFLFNADACVRLATSTIVCTQKANVFSYIISCLDTT